MRGIVIEKNDNRLIIMTNEGQFLEMKSYDKTVEIGQEIEVKNTTVYKPEVFRKIASIAAAIIIFLSGGYGILGHYMVYGYVDVDINPSVELSYNLYKRVISVKGLNEDGINLLTKIKDYKNKPIQAVVNKVIDSAIEEEYIKSNEENTVLVTITENKNEINDKTILREIDTHIKSSSIEAEVVVVKSDKKSFEDAKQSNLSPGKLKLIEKAADVNKHINPKEIQEKSVKEIMNIIKESKKNDKELDKINKKVEKEEEKKDKKNEKKNEKTNKSNKKEEKSNTNVKDGTTDKKYNDENINDKKTNNDKNEKNINDNKSNKNLKDNQKDKKKNKENEKESKKNEKNDSKSNEKKKK